MKTIKKILLLMIIAIFSNVILIPTNAVYASNNQYMNSYALTENNREKLPIIRLNGNDAKDIKDNGKISVRESDSSKKKIPDNMKKYIRVGIAIILVIIILFFLTLTISKRKIEKVAGNSNIKKRKIDEPRLIYETRQEEPFYIFLIDAKNRNVVYQEMIFDKITVGRSLDNNISIPHDTTLSSYHCTFIKRGNLIFLKDNNSKNGTIYDNNRIFEETMIMSGKIIQIGKQQLIVQIDNVK